MTTQTPGEAIVTAEQMELAQLAANEWQSAWRHLDEEGQAEYLASMWKAINVTGLPQRVRELETIERNLTTLAEGYKRERDALEARLQEAELQLQDEKTAYRLLSEQWNRCDIERAALARNQSHD